MSCCWIGRGGNSARTSAGRFRITWPRSWSGWGSIDRTGWKLCAASVDCSSRRRGDRARSSMPRRAARGAGSRARRRLEPPLCRPLARRRAVNRHLHYAFTRRAWPPRALNSLPGAVSTRTNRSTSHVKRSRTHDSRLDTARSQTASRLRERMRWSIAPTDEFGMGV